MLNSNGGSFVPSFRGKELSLSVLKVMLAVGFTKVLVIRLMSFSVLFTE